MSYEASVDPEHRVYLSKTTSGPECYHTDRDCTRLNEDARAVRQSDFSHLRECQYCAGPPSGGEQSKPCPLGCGEEVVHVPDHLPSCPNRGCLDDD
jgi:hypothetical protein